MQKTGLHEKYQTLFLFDLPSKIDIYPMFKCGFITNEFLRMYAIYELNLNIVPSYALYVLVKQKAHGYTHIFYKTFNYILSIYLY